MKKTPYKTLLVRNIKKVNNNQNQDFQQAHFILSKYNIWNENQNIIFNLKSDKYSSSWYIH